MLYIIYVCYIHMCTLPCEFGKSRGPTIYHIHASIYYSVYNVRIELNVKLFWSVTENTRILSVTDWISLGISIDSDVCVYFLYGHFAGVRPPQLDIYIRKKKKCIYKYCYDPCPKSFRIHLYIYIYIYIILHNPSNISITTPLYIQETEYITLTYAIKSYFIYDFIVSEKLRYRNRISEQLPKYSKYPNWK